MTRTCLMGIAVGALALGAGCLGGDNPGAGGGFDVDAAADRDGNGNGNGNSPDAGNGDGNGNSPDAGSGDGAVGEHLLITEVMTTSVSEVSQQNAEFIEIYNPTGQSEDLANYYLADTQTYATLSEGADGAAPDFIAQFPQNAAIAAGEVIVVAVDGSEFEAVYGEAPDYSMRATGDEPAMIDVDIGTSGDLLTASGEMVALFSWDGEADLVADVDLVITGIPNEDADNGLFDKSTLGPIGDGSTYAGDALTVTALEEAPGDDQSVKRIALEDGEETQEGDGNGVTGHDETSENFLATWHKNTGEYTAPTPGDIPAALQPSSFR